MKQQYSKTRCSVLTIVLMSVLIAGICFVFSTKQTYAATATASWVTEENSAGQITSVKLDMSSISGYSTYHVIIYKDDKMIYQENVTTAVYDVSSKLLGYDSGIFRAEGMGYKTGGFTDFATASDLKFFTITIDKQGHGNNVKLNHIKDGMSIKTALRNGYISTFDAGEDGMLMRYYENGEAFEGVALHPLSNYSSVDELKSEVEAVTPLLNNDEVTQEAVNAAVARLQTAKGGLVEYSVYVYRVNMDASETSNNSVGSDWSFDRYVNGQYTHNGFEITSASGGYATVEMRITENDSVPEWGYGSATVALQDGFNTSFNITVVENRGRYSGNVATFTVTVKVTVIGRQ